MKRLIAVLIVLVSTGIRPAFAQQFKVGDHVHSTVSGFDGTIVEIGGIDGFVKVCLDGHQPENANWMNPKWLKPTGGPARPDASAAPQPKGEPGAQAGNPPGRAGNFAAGSRVEFDRAEGSKPQFGRWDSGTVIGRDKFGRIQIKGDNGITYSIQNDPRWILPGGSQTPGPRHDYNDHPVNPPATRSNPLPNRTNTGNGATGPLSGEWTVVSLDGRRYEPGAQNFNFVGSRYEILNQGMTMSGNFSVNGNSVQMISDDGSPFATFQYSMQGGQMVLSSPGTKYVLIPAHK